MAWSRKKKITIGVAVGAPVLLLVIGAAVLFVPEFFYSLRERDFRERIFANLNEEQTEALLSQVIEGNWDTVCVVGPYMPFEMISEPRVQRLENVPWLDDDRYFTIVVLTGSEVPQTIRVSRWIYLSSLNENQCFAREDEPVVKLFRTRALNGETLVEMGIATQKAPE